MIKRGPISSILKASLPAALDLSSQPVMWLIEAVFIGRLSAAALGGVGFALQIILLTITLLQTFVMGAIILINRYLGSQDRRRANYILGQTMMMGFLLSIPVALIWYLTSYTFSSGTQIGYDDETKQAIAESCRYEEFTSEKKKPVDQGSAISRMIGGHASGAGFTRRLNLKSPGFYIKPCW